MCYGRSGGEWRGNAQPCIKDRCPLGYRHMPTILIYCYWKNWWARGFIVRFHLQRSRVVFNLGEVKEKLSVWLKHIRNDALIMKKEKVQETNVWNIYKGKNCGPGWETKAQSMCHSVNIIPGNLNYDCRVICVPSNGCTQNKLHCCHHELRWSNTADT